MKTRLIKSLEYIKGYCDKHNNCSEHCKLFDREKGSGCLFYIEDCPPADLDKIIKKVKER